MNDYDRLWHLMSRAEHKLTEEDAVSCGLKHNRCAHCSGFHFGSSKHCESCGAPVRQTALLFDGLPVVVVDFQLAHRMLGTLLWTGC